MKKNPKILLIKQILLMLSLTFYSSTQGMDLQQSITTFLYNRLEGESYQFGKYFVMLMQTVQLKLALFAYQLSPQACDLGLQIATNQLKQIEENLKQEELNAINDIFTEFKINTEQQLLIRSWLDQAKEFTLQHYQSTPIENAPHDPDFPSNIFSILKNNNIHPLGVTLKLKATGKLCAQAMIGAIDLINSEDDGKKTLTYIANPTITVFTQNYFSLPITCQKGLLIHEVEHLRSFHPLIGSLRAYPKIK